jgi:tetratricopeptide (TPR) repeat protein
MSEAEGKGEEARLLDEAFGNFARGKADAARDLFEKAATLRGASEETFLQANFQLGVMAMTRYNPRGAIDWFAKVHARRPDFPGLAVHYGHALLAAGEAKAAVALLNQMGAASTPAQLMLARAEAKAGEEKQAVARFERLMAEVEADPGLLCEYAFALLGAGQKEKAEKVFGGVRTKFSSHFDTLVKEAEAFRADHHMPEAARLLTTAARIAPEEPRVLFDLGMFFHDLGLKNEAEAAFKASLRRQQGAAAYGQLAALYEKANDLNNAWATATLGIRLFPADPYLSLTLARCERRAGKRKEARARLEATLGTTRDPSLRPQILYQLGWHYDDEDQTEKAFATYREAKKLSAELAKKSAFDPDVPITFIEKVKAVDLNALPRFPFRGGAKGEAREVAFLVGFPRSGTTLLNQILDSHPKLVALEEKPVLPLVSSALVTWNKDYPEGLPALDAGQVAELRSHYFRLARDYAAFDETSVLIDKLPLNIAHIPFILTLFPEAKILLALRHPLGSTLSCFMHNFRLNNAMVHMFSLEDITALYAKVMGLWLDFAAARTMAVHRVRYESIVADLPGEAERLCAFLGVPFSPEMLRFDQHARAKGLINTPSYHQVVRPLYGESVERWRRYEKFLEPYATRLAPFIRAFGYAE